MATSSKRPAEVLTVDHLLAKMRAGTEEVYEIQMRELTIPVRVLSVDEFNEIRRDAKKFAAATPGSDVTDEHLHVQKTTLKLASRVTRGGVPLLGDKLLGLLTIDEVNFLYDEYIAIMDRVNPNTESLTPEQFQALVDALKKNTITSSDLGLRQLKAICTSFQELIQRLETAASQTASSPGGQP
jgi:hypothetical protein